MRYHSHLISRPLASFAVVVFVVFILFSQAVQMTVQAGRSDLAGPTGSTKFGAGVYVLPNGNFVVTDPYFSPGTQVKIGAVYLYNGATRQLIRRITGSTDNDMVGSGGIQILKNGDFVVISPRWNNGSAAKAGAVTACSATAGCPTTSTSDTTVTASNSLVGSHTNDYVGTSSSVDTKYMTDYSTITPISGGAYLVRSAYWDTKKGAVTYCSSGSSPNCLGVVSSSNSLVGSTSEVSGGPIGDYIGLNVTLVPGGGYIVRSSYWTNGTLTSAGAVTPCGASGCTGPVSTSNSLYGNAAAEQIGMSVTLLTGGGFAVQSYNWGNAYSGLGAVTFCASLTDTKCVGKPISAENSLVGKTTITNTMIGSSGIVALPDGGYLVQSPSWKNDSGIRTGALTYCAVSGGTSTCTGQNVTDANSLTGDQSQDNVGSGVKLLSNGAFLTSSSAWHNWTGAVTYCSSASACMGQDVSSANSLVGGNVGVSWSDSTGGDQLGNGGSLVLSNGEYVVFSSNWDPAGTNAEKGAATFCPATGCKGSVSLANSLTGSKANDRVGLGAGMQLPGGAIFIASPYWNNGTLAKAGAVTFCAAPADCMGATVEASNSLVSDQANTEAGYYNYWALSNGSYLVGTPNWQNGTAAVAGSLTWCPATGCKGMTISASNSLVGSHANDYVGWQAEDVGDALYLTWNDGWQNGTLRGAGAVTLCVQSAGCSGLVTTGNSVVGAVEGWYDAAWGYYSSFSSYDYDILNHRLLVGLPMENKVVFFTLADAPTVTTGTASGLTSSGATLNGTVNANGSSTTVTFEYGLTTSYGTTVTATQSPVTGSSSTSVSKAITGLTPGTTYHYRVVATSLGGVVNGLDQTFTTSTPEIRISGNAGTGGATLSYTDGTAKTVTADSSGNYMFTVPYHWSGTVTPSKAGYTFTPSNKEYTSLETDRTDQGYQATYIPPQVQPASALRVRGFTANWNSCPGATAYFLDVATDSGFTHFVSGYENRSVGNVTALSVAGLEIHTTYYYRVRATDGSIMSSSSGTVEADTTWGAFIPIILR